MAQWTYFGVSVAQRSSCWPPRRSVNPVALLRTFSRAETGLTGRSSTSRSSWFFWKRCHRIMGILTTAESRPASTLAVPLAITSLGLLR